MNKKYVVGASVIGLSLFALSACKDPNANKPKAVVTEAKEVPSLAVGKDEKMESIAFSDGAQVGFVGSKVTGSHKGGFNRVSGSISLIAGKIERSSVTVTVDTTSVFTDTERLTNHLRGPDFFDVEKFPKAVFQSTEIKVGGDGKATHTIIGNLDLHGQKRSISFPATISISDTELSGKAEFVINRKDFGINYAGKADDLIRDTVALTIAFKGARKTN